MKKNILPGQTKLWDVVVIGGGPAGMTAALEAGARGKKVLLLEKNSGVGKKLLITGGGRCNVTNNKPVVREMLSKYKDAGKFLFSTFMQYGVTETINFFKTNGLDFKEENEGRLFPVTNTAQSVQDVLVAQLKKHHVTIETSSPVVLVEKNNTGFLLTLDSGAVVTASTVIMAVGGTARPETGSTGDALPWLAALGHRVHAQSTTLVPITVAESWAKKLGGVSLPSAVITVQVNGKKRTSATGKMLFTHVGLSGPLILNQSKLIGDLLIEGTVTIKLDLVPELAIDVVQAQLLHLFQATPNKKLKNILTSLIKTALVSPLLDTLELDGEVAVHSMTARDRKRIGMLLKAVPLTVTGLLGTDKAVATAGGVDLTEVNFKTMESRIVPRLYLVGDVLNINRPTGGYSLQLCWSTGAVAGRHV